MSDKQKYYINETGLINIQCPSCKKARMISVDKFKGNKNTVKIKCSCQNIFQIDIEFRQKYRKNVNFFGSYKKPHEHEHMSKDCIIINLSLSGIAFKINNDLTIKENDELIVKFTLDNKEKYKIEKSIKICYIDSENGIAGGEFLYSKIGSYDKQIYYFLK